MKKIGDVTSTADKNDEWTNGNVAAGIPPTVLESGWLNSVQREILGVLTKAGIPQDKNNDNQLSEAISKIITGGNYATAEDLKKKLTKNENGADIPDKPKFIENLGLGEAAKSGLKQKTGTSTTDVMSQNAVTDALGKKLNISDANFQPKGNYATNEALNNKLDKTSVVQSTGQSTAQVMSQKAVTDALGKKLNITDLPFISKNKADNDEWVCGDTGLTVKWGSSSSSPVKFKKPFDKICLFVLVSPNQDRGTAMYDSELHVSSKSINGFTISRPNDYNRSYIAIGY